MNIKGMNLDSLRVFQKLPTKKGTSGAIYLVRKLMHTEVVESDVSLLTGECTLTLLRQDGAICGFHVSLVGSKSTIEPLFCLVDNGGLVLETHSEDYSGLNIYISETDSVLLTVNTIAAIETVLEGETSKCLDLH